MTSIAAAFRVGTKPASWRTRDARPSAATVRGARSSRSPSRSRYRTPRTAPPSTITSVTRAPRRSSKHSCFAASPTTKSRNSTWGIIAMKGNRDRSRVKSARTAVVPPLRRVMRRSLAWSRASSGSARPRSSSISSVEGCTVSPRNARSKSSLASSSTTGTPRRARSRARTAPAGPPPTMQQPVLSAMPPPSHDASNRTRATADQAAIQSAEPPSCSQAMVSGAFDGHSSWRLMTGTRVTAATAPAALATSRSCRGLRRRPNG